MNNMNTIGRLTILIGALALLGGGCLSVNTEKETVKLELEYSYRDAVNAAMPIIEQAIDDTFNFKELASEENES